MIVLKFMVITTAFSAGNMVNPIRINPGSQSDMKPRTPFLVFATLALFLQPSGMTGQIEKPGVNTLTLTVNNAAYK